MSWAFKPLGEILEQSGYHRAGDRELPVLSITMKQGLVDQADKFKKRIASTDTSNYRVVYKNELVVGFPIDEGVLGFQTKYPAGIVSPAYDIWKLKNEAESHIPYLERYLRSPQARRLYASRMQGAVARRRSLTKSDFLKLEVPFPPIDDQIRIAHLLGKVEGLIAQRKRHLQQLDELLKSVFLEMFGDPVRNEKGWTVLKFSELFAIPPKIGTTKPASGDVGIPVVRVGEIGSLEVRFDKCATVELSTDEYSKCKVEIGDILLARAIGSQEQLGKASLITKLERPIAFDSHVMRIRFDTERVVPYFAYFWLRSSGGRALFLKASGKTSVQFNINAKQISSIGMPLPPQLFQEQFATFVEKIEALSFHYRQGFADLQSLYGVVSQKAFKGELDLSRVPLPATVGQDDQPVAIDLVLPQAEASAIPEWEIDPLLSVLKNPPSLEEIVHRWLDIWLMNLRETPFSVNGFMAYVQMRLEKLQPDSDFVVDQSHYEHVKAWVFDALADGRLKQTYDDAGNRILIKAGQA